MFDVIRLNHSKFKQKTQFSNPGTKEKWSVLVLSWRPSATIAGDVSSKQIYD